MPMSLVNQPKEEKMINIRKVLNMFLYRESAPDEEQAIIAAAITEEINRDDYPKIVCLCGSTRFYQEFQEANFKETMAGNIVLSVGFYPHAQKEAHHSEDVGVTKQEKVDLDELHKRKIDLCDEIYIINKDKYIGDSTLSELAYARTLNKTVRYLEPYGH